MSTFLQFFFGGLLAGAVFALIALGWVLIFNVSGILNLAQGEFVMVGALTYVKFRTDYELGQALSIVLAIAVTIAIGIVLDMLILRRISAARIIPMILATVGASIVLRELASEFFGKDPLRVKPILTGKPYVIGGATVLPHTVLLWVTVAVLLAALTIYFTATIFGKAMRACSENLVGAQSVGISPTRMRTIAFAMSAGLGAAAGILIVPLTSMSWDGGTTLGIKGFIAAVFGGMGSYVGAVLGGLLLGLLESMSAGYISSAYKDVFALATLIVLLLIRPQGLLGKRNSEQAGLLRRLSDRRSGRQAPADSEPSGHTDITHNKEQEHHAMQ